MDSNGFIPTCSSPIPSRTARPRCFTAALKKHEALASYLRSLGGTIVTGREIRSLGDLPPGRIIMLDVTPRQLLAMSGDRLPRRYRRKLERYRYGPGVFKVDWALSGPIPWQAAGCRRAATAALKEHGAGSG